MAAKSTTASIIGGLRETGPPRQPSGDVRSQVSKRAQPPIHVRFRRTSPIPNLCRHCLAVEPRFNWALVVYRNRQADRLSGGPVTTFGQMQNETDGGATLSVPAGFRGARAFTPLSTRAKASTGIDFYPEDYGSAGPPR